MFVIEVPYFNLDQIYNSRQCPRWIKLKDMKYVIPFRDKALKIEQQKERLIMSYTEDDFYNVWFEYLDLRTDYMAENGNIKKLGGKFKVPSNRGSGIHILNQDKFEAYILGKLISNAGYDKAFAAMNHIAETCGVCHKQNMREAGRVTWYEFPSPEMILEKFDKLKRMGKINSWLMRLCLAIVNDGYDISKGDNEFFKLYGLHELNVFPTNAIEETITKNFKCDIDEFEWLFLDEIENKGLVYMYILHHITNSPKEVKVYGIG